MSHPFYINPDEEIISIIARLRETPEADITFVFPKRSAVTQSAINLKLLAREAEKRGKRITLVSQNENTLALAEKIGFATLPYTSDMQDVSEEINIPEVVPQTTPEPTASNSVVPEGESSKIRDIGSPSFLVGDAIQPDSAQAPSTTAPENISGQNIRIRNASPNTNPGLNSLQTPPQPTAPPQPTLSPKPSMTTPPMPITPLSENAQPKSSLHSFYNRPERSPQMPTPTTIPPVPTPVSKPPKPVSPRIESKSFSYALWVFGAGIALAIGVLLFFLILPKALVTVTPYQITDRADQTFTLPTDGQGAIPLTKLPQEITVTIPGIASGAPSGQATPQGNKASGTIKITSTYSQDQPLVATTRFQSENGNIYRIQQGITVPANSSIEATVVADGSGDSYNLDQGTFTVPGLKGTDKYDQITAETVSALTGGDGETSSSNGTFIKADIETLHTQAQAKAVEEFSQKINNDGDRYTFTENVPAELKSEDQLPTVGSTPGEYDYTATFMLTPYTLSKEDIETELRKKIPSDYDGIPFTTLASELSFMSFALNDDATEATIKASLDTNLASEINQSTLKDALVGKNTEQVTKLLESHPEIQKIEIAFKPSWALKRIPHNKEKIELIIKEGSPLSE